MVKDYRGKDGERVVWEFDAPLVSQINDVLGRSRSRKGSGQKSENPGDHRDIKRRAGPISSTQTHVSDDVPNCL